MDNSSNNKRIAKNTMFLYFRMIITTIVGLYTSRVVLNTLGVEDYGIYGLTGGCVSMFGFLNSSMSGATSRFLTFEMKRGNGKILNITFSSALIIHIILALIVAFLAETIGMWFLMEKLVIPEGRMFAAQIVLHCSVIGMFFTVIQIPYNATIISHENMDVYAYIEMLNVFLKLAIVYLLTIGDFDKLILYAILHLCVTCLIALSYITYGIVKFPETHFKRGWNSAVIKPMLSYSGWDLFGLASTTFRSQGTNFLINMFFGVIYNTAASVALTVQGVLLGLCHNILTAFRPQIIKQYSVGNNNESVNLIYQASKFTSLLMLLIAIPFIIEMDYIMKLWLGNVPELATLFCRIMLITAVFNMIECCVNVGINASGRMKAMSFYTGLVHFAVLLITWIVYRLGAPVYSVYIVAVFATIVNTGIKAFLVCRYIPPFNIHQLFNNAYLPLLYITIMVGLFVIPVYLLMPDSLYRLLLVFIVTGFTGSTSAFYIALNKTQRNRVSSFVKLRFRGLHLS